MEEKRRSGRSTRLIDAAIQILFQQGYVRCKDHFDHPDAHRILFEKVLRRIKSEHDRDVRTEPKEYKITLLKF